MSFFQDHLLTCLTFAPSLGALVIALLRREQVATIRVVALASSLASLALVLVALARFDQDSGALQLVEKHAWIPTLRSEYFLGVDGIGLMLVLLTGIVVPLALLASWEVRENVKAYFFLLLVLQTAMYGVFTALSFFHWFLFWELSLIPAFFLVKLWGGVRANAAAMKFFLYTLVGSVALLLGFQALFQATGTFDFVELAALGRAGSVPSQLAVLAADAGLGWSLSTCSIVIGGGIALAFFVKAPLWPFHTWLPDAYVQAPAPVTMLMTAVLSKMGIYGLLRIVLPIFPELSVAASEGLLFLAVMTVVGGAFAALAQTDLKRMAAYSSINHVGYCLVGVFAAVSAGNTALAGERAFALDGVALQMFNHGISGAALFFLIGALELRTGARGIDDFGGLRRVVPWFSLAFGIVLFGSLGLPGLSGFVGELLIFKGALALHRPLAIGAMVGIVITAVFLLRVMQRVWWGPVNERWAKLADLSARERVIALVFVGLIVGVGILPGPLTALVDASVAVLVETIQQAHP
jgi:NADH-quinone oxidoreductase subunit M